MRTEKDVGWRARNGLFLLAVVFAAASGQGVVPPAWGWTGCLAAALTVLFIPGFLLCEILFRRGNFDFFEWVPVCFCLSLSALLLPCLLAAAALSLSMPALARIYCALCVLLLIVNSVSRRRSAAAAAPAAAPSSRACRIVLGLAVILSIAWAAWLGGGIFGDSHAHLAHIRKIKELAPLTFARDHYFKELSVSMFGTSLWHTTVALLSQLSGRDIIDIWYVLPIVVVPVTILAFYAFARALFRREAPALLSTLLYIFIYGVLNIDPLHKQIGEFSMWTMSQRPPNVSRDIFLPVALIFVFRFLSTPGAKNLLLAALFALATVMAYLPYYINLELYLVPFVLVTAVLGIGRLRESARLLVITLVVSAVISAYSLPMMMALLPIKNPSHAAHINFEGFKGYTIFLFDRYPIINPVKLLWPDHLLMLTVLMTPLLILYRKQRGALFLLSTSAAVIAVTLNPVLLSFLQHSDKSLHRMWRIPMMYPSLLIIGFFGAELGRLIRERWLSESKLIRCLVAVSFAAVAVLVSAQPVRRQMDLRAGRVNALTATPSVKALWETGVLRGTEGDVVLVDRITGAVWPVYFPHFILDTYHAICSPVLDPTDRGEAIFKVYDYRIPMEETLALLDEYEVDLIAINLDRPKDFPIWGLDIEKMKEKFASRPEMFDLLYEGENITVFRYLKPDRRS